MCAITFIEESYPFFMRLILICFSFFQNEKYIRIRRTYTIQFLEAFRTFKNISISETPQDFFIGGPGFLGKKKRTTYEGP
jgi:hypothetical protein